MHYSKQRQIHEVIPSGKVGLTDQIKVIRDGKILNLGVKLNITHSKAENLTIKLISPDGTSAIIHKKEKNKGKYLLKSIDSAKLKKFIGKKSKGNWSLHIHDADGKKPGCLCNWSLAFEMADSKKSEVFTPSTKKEELVSKHNCHEAGKVKSLKASVHIAHGNIADLKVSLSSPGGKELVLHNKEGNKKKSLKKTYSTKDLAKMVGEKAKGVWTLKVLDLKGKNSGSLKNWGLKIVAE